MLRATYRPAVKAIAFLMACIGFQGAEAGVQTDWQTPEQVLAAIDPANNPTQAKVWHSPRGPVVLHGDLFGDGRHLALVGTDRTTLATGSKEGWQVGAPHNVAPAWVPPGEAPHEVGYFQSGPPEVPFVLEDLDGDGTPELLVAFDNDGYLTGYAIAKWKDGKLRFLNIRSEHGRPDRASGCMTLTTVTSGRKAWWNGTTYYRWTRGDPEPVATWIEDARDPEAFRWIAVRHDRDLGDSAFEILPGEADWQVRKCSWDGAVTTSAEKDLARVSFAPSDDFGAETVLMFSLATGLKGDLTLLHEANRRGVDLKAAAAGMTITGGEEAKRLLKVPSDPR